MEPDYNQTYKSHIHLGTPLLYTGNQCKGAYNLANAQVAHINIYCKKVFRVDYEIFSGLKGSIKEIHEHNRFEPGNSLYSRSDNGRSFLFNEQKELIQIEELETHRESKIEFIPSLKACRKQIITSYINSKVHSIITWHFDKNMQYVTSESIIPSRKEPKHIVNYNTNNEKYIFRDDRIVQKNRYFNNAEEQSRAIIKFDEFSNIMEVRANKQNDKFHAYYGSVYHYNKYNNIEKIQFYRNSLGQNEDGINREYLFDYDENGNLKNYKLNGSSNCIATYSYDTMGNLISCSKNKNRIIYRYKFDNHGNWIKRIELTNPATFLENTRRKISFRNIEYYD